MCSLSPLLADPRTACVNDFVRHLRPSHLAELLTLLGLLRGETRRILGDFCARRRHRVRRLRRDLGLAIALGSPLIAHLLATSTTRWTTSTGTSTSKRVFTPTALSRRRRRSARDCLPQPQRAGRPGCRPHQHQLARNLLNVERVRCGGLAPAREAFTTLNEHDIVLATMGRCRWRRTRWLHRGAPPWRKQDGTEGGGAQGRNVGLAIVGLGGSRTLRGQDRLGPVRARRAAGADGQPVPGPGRS